MIEMPLLVKIRQQPLWAEHSTTILYLTIGHTSIMKALLLTNHLKEYGGSEIQILELYRYLKSQNHQVHVYANLIGEPICQHFDPRDLRFKADEVDISAYSFIWSQHGTLPLFFALSYDDFSTRIFSVHLSPYENTELLQTDYMKQIGAHFIANSPETRDKLRDLGIDSDILISYNCAPPSFQAVASGTPDTLSNILLVSNHPPEEIRQAVKILRTKYTVHHIGGSNSRLLTPEILSSYDCIITIGKTVQYALLADKPVYCYDHFGGCGYLNAENYEKARYYNFSGRHFGKKSAEEIAAEISTGFEASKNFPASIDKTPYRLDYFVNNILLSPPRILTQEHQTIIRRHKPSSEKFAQLYLDIAYDKKRLDKYKILLKTTLLLLFISILIICFSQ